MILQISSLALLMAVAGLSAEKKELRSGMTLQINKPIVFSDWISYGGSSFTLFFENGHEITRRRIKEIEGEALQTPIPEDESDAAKRLSGTVVCEATFNDTTKRVLGNDSKYKILTSGVADQIASQVVDTGQPESFRMKKDDLSCVLLNDDEVLMDEMTINVAGGSRGGHLKRPNQTSIRSVCCKTVGAKDQQSADLTADVIEKGLGEHILILDKGMSAKPESLSVVVN